MSTLRFGLAPSSLCITGGNCLQLPGSILDCTGSTGVANQVLSSTGAQSLCWVNVVFPSVFTAKGDILAASGASTPVALPVGTDGQVLTACSACASGLTWAAGGGGGATQATPIALGTVYGCSDLTYGNASVGPNALACLTGGEFGCNNTAVGVGAGGSLVESECNTAIGCGALGSAQYVTGNTAVGHNALCSLGDNADYNVAIGCGTLISSVDGAYNVAVGTDAGLYVTSGMFNTIIGDRAGCNITTGSCNVAIGLRTEVPNPAGDSQLVIGSIFSNWLTGDSTFAIKPGAGIRDCANSTGTAGQVLMSNGSNAVCWGTAGGGSAATPIALGTVFGCSINTTSGNQIIGYCAASALSGSGNAVLGSCALGNSSTAGTNNNVAIGTWTMLNTVAAVTGNVGVGYRALGGGNAPGLSGSNNVGIGNAAGLGITSGAGNVVIGSANGYPTTGNNNVIIGNSAQTTGSLTGSNNTVIGFGAATTAGTVSNTINLGNFSVTVIRAAVTTITAISDARDKTDIIPLPVGLDFIKTLKPVKFTWSYRGGNEVKDGTSEAGFIAQDLQEAQETAGVKDYLGLVYDENPERLEASPGKLIPVLVNAIKELSASLDSLRVEFDAYKQSHP